MNHTDKTKPALPARAFGFPCQWELPVRFTDGHEV